MDKELEKEFNICDGCGKNELDCVCEAEIKIVMTLKKEGFDEFICGIDIAELENAFKIVMDKTCLFNMALDEFKYQIREYLKKCK